MVEVLEKKSYLLGVVEPYGCRPVQYSSACLQVTRMEYPPTRVLGSGPVSLVPYLGGALGVVGLTPPTHGLVVLF